MQRSDPITPLISKHTNFRIASVDAGIGSLESLRPKLEQREDTADGDTSIETEANRDQGWQIVKALPEASIMQNVTPTSDDLAFEMVMRRASKKQKVCQSGKSTSQLHQPVIKRRVVTVGSPAESSPVKRGSDWVRQLCTMKGCGVAQMDPLELSLLHFLKETRGINFAEFMRWKWYLCGRKSFVTNCEIVDLIKRDFGERWSKWAVLCETFALCQSVMNRFSEAVGPKGPTVATLLKRLRRRGMQPVTFEVPHKGERRAVGPFIPCGPFSSPNLWVLMCTQSGRVFLGKSVDTTATFFLKQGSSKIRRPWIIGTGCMAIIMKVSGLCRIEEAFRGMFPDESECVLLHSNNMYVLSQHHGSSGTTTYDPQNLKNLFRTPLTFKSLRNGPVERFVGVVIGEQTTTYTCIFSQKQVQDHNLSKYEWTIDDEVGRQEILSEVFPTGTSLLLSTHVSGGLIEDETQSPRILSTVSLNLIDESAVDRIKELVKMRKKLYPLGSDGEYSDDEYSSLKQFLASVIVVRLDFERCSASQIEAAEIREGTKITLENVLVRKEYGNGHEREERLIFNKLSRVSEVSQAWPNNRNLEGFIQSVKCLVNFPMDWLNLGVRRQFGRRYAAIGWVADIKEISCGECGEGKLVTFPSIVPSRRGVEILLFTCALKIVKISFWHHRWCLLETSKDEKLVKHIFSSPSLTSRLLRRYNDAKNSAVDLWGAVTNLARPEVTADGILVVNATSALNHIELFTMDQQTRLGVSWLAQMEFSRLCQQGRDLIGDFKELKKNYGLCRCEDELLVEGLSQFDTI